MRGLCRYGNACGRFHSPTGLPYHWQWREGAASYAGDEVDDKGWRDLSRESSWEVEKSFSDPAMESCQVKLDSAAELAEIDFEQMRYGGKSGKVGQGQIRRLGTPSVTAEGIAKAPVTSPRRYGTVWKWYWVTEAGRKQSLSSWQLYDVSEDMEQEFVSKRSVEYQPEGKSFVIDFRRMMQLDRRDGTQCMIRRRPVRYKPLIAPRPKLPGMKIQYRRTARPN